MEKSEIHAVDLVRKIRDDQAALLADKSEEEVLAFFRAAGQRARKSAEEHQKSKGTREKDA